MEINLQKVFNKKVLEYNHNSNWLKEIILEINTNAQFYQIKEVNLTYEISRTYDNKPNFIIDEKINLNVQSDCMRCLKKIDKTYNEKFQFIAINSKNTNIDEEEFNTDNNKDNIKEILKEDFSLDYSKKPYIPDEDDDIIYLKNFILDLAKLSYETIILTIPYTILCKEDCLGICQQCKTNLNIKKCSCKKDIEKLNDFKFNSFAKLKNIKL